MSAPGLRWLWRYGDCTTRTSRWPWRRCFNRVIATATCTTVTNAAKKHSYVIQNLGPRCYCFCLPPNHPLLLALTQCPSVHVPTQLTMLSTGLLPPSLPLPLPTTYGAAFEAAPPLEHPSDLNLYPILHDTKGEASWQRELSVYLPRIRRKQQEGEIAVVGLHVDCTLEQERDLIDTLNLAGNSTSPFHEKVVDAIRKVTRPSRGSRRSRSRRDIGVIANMNDNDVHNGDGEATRTNTRASVRCSTSPPVSSEQVRPSTTCRSGISATGPAPPSTSRVGIRCPDIFMRYSTIIQGQRYEGSVLEGEFKVFKHSRPDEMPPAPGHLAPSDGGEDRHARENTLSYSFETTWKRGLIKAAVYLVIAHEMSGTRLGVCVTGEYMQRLAIIGGDDAGYIAVVVEFDEQLVATQQLPLELDMVALVNSNSAATHMPWCFADANGDANPEALATWGQLFDAAFNLIRDVSYAEPLERLQMSHSDPLIDALVHRGCLKAIHHTTDITHTASESCGEPNPSTSSSSSADTSLSVPDSSDLWDTDTDEGERSPTAPWTRRQTDKYLDSLSESDLDDLLRDFPRMAVVCASPTEMSRLVAIIAQG